MANPIKNGTLPAGYDPGYVGKGSGTIDQPVSAAKNAQFDETNRQATQQMMGTLNQTPGLASPGASVINGNRGGFGGMDKSGGSTPALNVQHTHSFVGKGGG